MNGCTLHLLNRILKYLAWHTETQTYGGENTEDLREALSYLISEADGKLMDRYGLHSFKEWYAPAHRESGEADGCREGES